MVNFVMCILPQQKKWGKKVNGSVWRVNKVLHMVKCFVDVQVCSGLFILPTHPTSFPSGNRAASNPNLPPSACLQEESIPLTNSSSEPAVCQAMGKGSSSEQ